MKRDGWPSFSGGRSESALEYLEDLEAEIILAKIGTDEKENIVRRSRFRKGLKKAAATWLRTELPDASSQS